jgi:hypothetical protein
MVRAPSIYDPTATLIIIRWMEALEEYLLLAGPDVIVNKGSVKGH